MTTPQNSSDELDFEILKILDPKSRIEWKDPADVTEWQHKEVKRLISLEVAQLAESVIGEDLPNAKSVEGHPVAMYYVNKRLAEQRLRLAALRKGRE